jgi:hypothetical protein
MRGMATIKTQEDFDRAVDRALQSRVGLGIGEMVGDWPSADFYEAGDIEGAVDWIIEESGFEDFTF